MAAGYAETAATGSDPFSRRVRDLIGRRANDPFGCLHRDPLTRPLTITTPTSAAKKRSNIILTSDLQLARVKQISGHARVVARWKVAMADVDQIARAGAPSAVYVHNEPFWFALRATAVYVSVADETPSKADLMFEAIKDNVVKLPENIVAGAKAVASAASDAASGVASGVGKAINKGLLSGIGTPLLVGGGVLAAIWLSRRGKPSGQAV